MTIEEMKNYEIDNYCRLQRIKANNGTQKNAELDYEIRQSAAKLETFGVNLERLTFTE